MIIEGWRYYNHAMVTTGAPGSPVNLKPIESGDIWKGEGYAFLARWVTDYDCGYPTEWWYCLKDNEYNIESLNSKKRYRITKGRRFFDVKTIDENEYINKLANIQIRAYSDYPEEYRPDLTSTKLELEIYSWSKQKHVVFGAFNRESGDLCGYSLINEYDKYYYFAQQKVDPMYEKDEINAALVDGIIRYYEDRIRKGVPLVDGQRNTIHDTGFQDYLCRIFGFRKVYCKLNIKYRNWVGIMVKILYPFRNFISSKKGKLFHQISSVLYMEQIYRSFI